MQSLILALIIVLVGLTIDRRIKHMNDKLQTSIDALVADTAATQGKLSSVLTFIQGVPDLVAAAVAQALSNANVADETAAAEVDSARQTIDDSVDQVLSAIDQNPQSGDTGSVADAGAGSGGDTSGAGTSGADTSGAGADSGAADTGTTGADAGAGGDAGGADTGTTGADTSGTGEAGAGDQPVE